MQIETLVTVGIHIIALGVFMGVTQSSLRNIAERLGRIENKSDGQSKELGSLRERIAVIEHTMKIKEYEK